MILRSSSRMKQIGAPAHWMFAQHAFGQVEAGQLICIREEHLAHVCPVFGLGRCGPPKATSLPQVLPGITKPASFMGELTRPAAYPELWAQSPLPIETFLHIGTWRTRYPKYHWDYSLEFNVAHSYVKGFLFELDTLCHHPWSVETEWASDYAQLDLLDLCDLRDRVSRIVWAMDFDWRHFPQACSPDYVHVQPPPELSCAEPGRKAPRICDRKRPLSPSYRQTHQLLHPASLLIMTPSRLSMNNNASSASRNCKTLMKVIWMNCGGHSMKISTENGKNGVTFRRVPAASTEFLVQKPVTQFSSASHGSLQTYPAKAWAIENVLPQRQCLETSLFFCFRVSRFNKGARRNEEECHMHIAYIACAQLYLCTLHRRAGSSAIKGSLRALLVQ